MGGLRRWTLALALVLAILGSAYLLVPLARLGRPLAIAGLVALGAVVAAAARRVRATEERSEGTVWDAIPGWQYTGRHVESGGLTRDEQERALRDVQEEAARRRRK